MIAAIIVLSILLVMAGWPQAKAQPPGARGCVPRPIMMARIKQHGEDRTFISIGKWAPMPGMVVEGLVELFIAKDHLGNVTTWSLVTTDSNNRSCMVSFGQNGRFINLFEGKISWTTPTRNDLPD